MRKQIDRDGTGKATGYRLWLSANETYSWAFRSGSAWPCSGAAGNRIWVDVDGNGLCGFAMNGRADADMDGDELDAIVADHVPADCRHLWPTWGVK